MATIEPERFVVEVERFDAVTESMHLFGAMLTGALAFFAFERSAYIAAMLIATTLLILAHALHRFRTRHTIVYRLVADASHIEAGKPGEELRIDFADFQRVILNVRGDEPCIELVGHDRSRHRIDAYDIGCERLAALGTFLYRVCPLRCSDSWLPERNRPARRARG